MHYTHTVVGKSKRTLVFFSEDFEWCNKVYIQIKVYDVNFILICMIALYQSYISILWTYEKKKLKSMNFSETDPKKV